MTASPEYIRVKDVKSYCGVSRATIYRWMKKDDIKPIKRDNCSFIHKDILKNLIEGIPNSLGD